MQKNKNKKYIHEGLLCHSFINFYSNLETTSLIIKGKLCTEKEEKRAKMLTNEGSI
jgi:hypothetical protein